MNTICHHKRSAGTSPASATSEPIRVAGIAAVAHAAADPYTSMRLPAPTSVNTAATSRLTMCAA